MFRKIIIILSVAGMMVISSCSTYLIPVDAFKQQFAGIDSTRLVMVHVIGPVGEPYQYPANPIKTIHCTDKQGNPYELPNSPSIEVRFTYGENQQRTVFYFDRIYIRDNQVVGSPSRFIPSVNKSIPLESITKIEVQDGKKNFHYANR